jgi:hypothetical protein
MHMPERVSTIDVRQRIGDMLNRVSLRHDEFIIERKGKPLAALVQSNDSNRCGDSRARKHSISLRGNKEVS